MPKQKTYRFVIEIPGTSVRDLKNELVYLLKESRLTPKDAGDYYWDNHIKEYSRVVSKRDPNSLAALTILLNNTVARLRNTADDLEKVTPTKDQSLTLVHNTEGI